MIRNKEWKPRCYSLSLAILAGCIACQYFHYLLTTSEYAAYTMRGGKENLILMDDIKKVNTKRTG